MNEEELRRFREFANGSPTFQAEAREVSTPSQLLTLAHGCGFELTMTDLLIGTRDWDDPHWPWAGQSKQFFRFFFHEGRLPSPEELNGL